MRMLRSPAIMALAIAGFACAAAACNEPYPPSLVTAFMGNCGKDDALKGFCGCLIGSIQKTIPLADFIEVGSRPGGVNADARYIAARQACTKKYPVPKTGASSTLQSR